MAKTASHPIRRSFNQYALDRTAMNLQLRARYLDALKHVPSLLVKAEVNGQELRLVLDSGTPELLVYRNHIDTRQEKLRSDPDTLILTAGGMSGVRWLRADVLLGKNHLRALDVAIADIDSDPQNDFDGPLGFAKVGFRKVTFDFQNRMG